MANAFDWRRDKRPSIFATDPAFTATKSGRTQAQASSEAGRAIVERRTKQLGRSPGYIPGLSRAERLASAPGAYIRRSGVR